MPLHRSLMVAARKLPSGNRKELTVARIVCQAIQRGDRLTFLWSEGNASFEPYVLAGAERDHFLRLADEAQQRLAAGLEADQGDAGLAELGHQLYRALFRADAGQRGSAAEVQQWLNEQTVAALEVLTDAPGMVPWALVCDQPRPEALWGRRYALGTGRRVNPLRATPLIEQPTHVLVLDPELAGPSLRPWQDITDSILQTHDAVAGRLRRESPDVIVVVGHIAAHGLRIGPDVLRLTDLRQWIDQAAEGNPEPVVVLLGIGPAGALASWRAQVAAATRLLPGLVANEVPLPAQHVAALAQGFLGRFLLERRALGQALHGLRQERGLPELALTAYAPLAVRLTAGTETDVPPEADTIPTMPLPETPYRPMAAYEYKDRPLFLGRDEETARCASLLDDGATCGVFLHGAAGVGKTSLLQAGVMPTLEQAGVGYRLLRDRAPLETPVAESDYPILVLRATGDLAGQLADALGDFCSQPYVYTTPTGRTVSVDLPALLRQALGQAPRSTAIQEGTAAEPMADWDDLAAFKRALWAGLCADPALLGRALEALTAALPFELVIAIDQGEELITEVRGAAEEARRQEALAMLLQLAEAPARCKVVLALRSDYLARLTSLLPERPGRQAWREFFVKELSRDRLAEALEGPTLDAPPPAGAEAPRQKYGFTFERGLAERIADDAWAEGQERNCSPLGFAQATCALLYERRGQPGALLRLADLRETKGTRLAPVKLLEARVRRLALPRKQQKAFFELINAMVTRHPGAGLTRDLVAARTDLPSLWKGTGPVEPIVNRAAKEAGLFAVQRLFIDGKAAPYVSLAHDQVAIAAQLRGEQERRAHYFGAMGDLFLTIPVILCAMALTFFVMKMSYASYVAPEDVSDVPAFKAMQRFAGDSAERFEAAQQQQYRGLLAQAEQALRSGNAFHAHQTLLTAPAGTALALDPRGTWVRRDMRGIEWRYLWRLAHNERRRFEGHRRTVEAVAVAPDGRLAASASLDGTTRVWSLAEGQILATLTGPRVPVHAVAFAPDGKALFTGSADGVVRQWDVSGLRTEFAILDKESAAFPGHKGAVRALVFARNGQLASAGDDHAVILWDVAQATKKATLTGQHEGPVYALAFSPDGTALASAGQDSTVVLWDVAAGKKRDAIKTAYHTIAALAFDPAGKTLATGGSEQSLGSDVGLVRFWDPATGKETRTPLPHGLGVFGLAYHPDGKALASAGKDLQIRLWDVASGSERATWVGSLGWVRSLTFSADGATLVSGGYDSTVRAWDTDQPSGPQVLDGHQDAVLALALGENDTLLASGSRDGRVHLWDVATGRAAGALPAQAGAVTALAFVTGPAKQPNLAVGTWGAKGQSGVKLWELQRGPKGFEAKELKALAGHDQGVTALAYSAGRQLASGDAGGTAIVWDLNTGKPAHVLPPHENGVRALAFDAKGALLLTAGHEGLVRFWDPFAGRPAAGLPPLRAHDGPIDGLATLELLADAQPLTAFVTGGQDQSVKLWILAGHGEEGTPVQLQFTSLAHHQPVGAVLASRALLASGGADQTVKLWDIFGGERLTLHGPAGTVRALAATRDLSVLAAASSDGKVRLWRAAPEDKRRAAPNVPE